jgi:hypothetical protein
MLLVAGGGGTDDVVVKKETPLPTKPPTRGRITRRLTSLGLVAGLVAVLVSTAIASGADGSWDLSKPGLKSTVNASVGDAPQGVAFDVRTDTPVAAVGIRAGVGTPTTLTAELRDITGMSAADAPGAAVIASGSVAVSGSAAEWRDVPLVTTLLANHRYDVRFQIPGGWGFGPNAVDQQVFDNQDFNNAAGFEPEVGGPFYVVDGGGGFTSTYTYGRTTLPHVHVVGAALDADSPAIEVTVGAGAELAPSGWYNAASSGTHGVTVEVTANDASPLSYVRCTDGATSVLDTTDVVSAIHLGDGIHSLSCTAEDVHGNRASTDAPVSVRVDQTAPTLAPIVDPNPAREGQFAEAFAKATDDFGVDATCDPVSTTQVGHHVVTCRAEDPAGNTATADAEYDVEYAFDGFFSPVRMGDTNRAKAGSSVPLKFSIGEYDGLDILAAGSPSVRACDGAGSVQVADGKLSYDAEAGQYVYVWRTDRAWAGSCREITVRLDDGSAKSVSFRMS